ncbi:hypothetical protein [Defluviitalea saccharophila]|uniref:Cell division protein ZapB n=1 Tax=Defluviitalea saccharophila TaxID=879970 RepID=A0ABZ2Y9E3_9FIRM
MVFTNAYQVLEHLMNNSKDGENSMWGLIKAEMERLQSENLELQQKNQTLEQALLELSMLVGGGI